MICRKCNAEKHTSNYYRQKGAKYGIRKLCKECYKKDIKSNFLRNPEKARRKNLKSVNKWQKNNKDKIKKWVDSNEEKFRRIHLKNKYKITLEMYNEMLLKQNNLCGICLCNETLINKKTGKSRPLSVDHCHQTGKIRGLLCNTCNKGLGHFKDSETILIRAIAYINKNMKRD